MAVDFFKIPTEEVDKYQIRYYLLPYFILLHFIYSIFKIFHVRSLTMMQTVTEFFKNSSRNPDSKSSRLHLTYQQQPFVPQCLLVLAVFCDIGHAYKSVDHKKKTLGNSQVYMYATLFIFFIQINTEIHPIP